MSKYRFLASFAVILATCGCLALCGQKAAEKAQEPETTPAEDLLGWRNRMDEVLDAHAWGSSVAGVYVADCQRGQEVFSRNPDVLLNPASNFKILTATAALRVLGPAFSFRTTLLYDGTFENGTIGGHLYLRGEGDPDIVYEAVWKMVKNLMAQGVRTVKGDLVADDTYFDGFRTIPDWSEDNPDDETHAYNSPLGALSFNFNTVALIVRPGEAVGRPVSVLMETPTGFVKIVNEATTGRKGTRNTLQFRGKPLPSGHELTLDGRMALGGGFRRYYRTVPDPPGFALALFREMLEKEGITVGGRNRLGKTPDSAIPLLYHHSRPLDILLKYMNKLSSNFISEQIVKAMGAQVYGPPGSSEKGIMVISDFIKSEALEWTGARFFNGSGLSERTRVSARQLVGVLCAASLDVRTRYDLLASLPISGIDGTLRNRMKGTPGVGRLRAKTGSIQGVFGFSGVLESQNQRSYAFCFLVNSLKGSPGSVKLTQDRWANVLISGPSNSPALLEPLSPTAVPALEEEAYDTGRSGTLINE